MFFYFFFFFLLFLFFIIAAHKHHNYINKEIEEDLILIFHWRQNGQLQDGLFPSALQSIHPILSLFSHTELVLVLY